MTTTVTTVWSEMIGRGFTPHGFTACVDGFPTPAWKPESVVLRKTHATMPERDRLKSVEKFRAMRQNRQDGFRLLVTDETIWVLSVPRTGNDSTPIEILGDFDTEPTAACVRENVITALVALYARAGLPPSAIRLDGENGKITTEIPRLQTFAAGN